VKVPLEAERPRIAVVRHKARYAAHDRKGGSAICAQKAVILRSETSGSARGADEEVEFAPNFLADRHLLPQSRNLWIQATEDVMDVPDLRGRCRFSDGC